MLTTENKKQPQVHDWMIWFFFDDENDAQTAFDMLCRNFDTLSKDKKVFTENGRKIAQYTDQPKLESTNSVEFILIKDELYERKYKLLFQVGRTYKSGNGT